jgi:hypothetical protein
MAHQRPFFRYMEGGGKRYVGVWHRRAGKDSAALNWTAIAAMQRVGTYWHMLPTAKQGRKVVWEYINKAGQRHIDQAFPQGLRLKVRNDEMRIELANGSMWQVVGADSYDSNVGANPVGIVFSEWSLTKPQAWDFVRPILAENGGWAIFIYTPRGRNHGWKQLEIARSMPNWMAEVLTVDDTGLVDRATIEEERRSGMTPELIQQEYYCSFEAPNTGSYYGRLLESARAEGRITRVPYDPALGVHTWWDLGVNDPTAIWFTQSTPVEHRVIDYYEGSGEGLAHYVRVLADRPYAYAGHHFPHDVQVRELGTGRSRIETLRELGIEPDVVQKLPIEDGIEAGRALIPLCWFDEEKCAAGLEALVSYHRKYDEINKCYAPHPEHDWSSNGADAWRMFAVGQNKTRAYREPARSRRVGWMAA